MNKYTMPEEKSEHEGTWLQWPHAFTYGEDYRKELEPIWIQMTTALSEGERVHIVAYNESEKERIAGVLFDHGLIWRPLIFLSRQRTMYGRGIMGRCLFMMRIRI